MSGEVVGLALVWGGAALALLLGGRALMKSAVAPRVRGAALGAFAVALIASFLLGPPPARSLSAPISVAFFSVLLLLFVTVAEDAQHRDSP